MNVIPLSAASAREQAGGKAATLARLRAAGYRVPDGFVVVTGACAAIDGAVPGALRAELEAALAELGGGPVAVRSSALGEDGALASFAGQLESVLDVRGVDALCQALVRCARSAASERVRAYREGGALRTAVLVQRMLHPEVAGVAFGVDPTTGDRAVIVEAVAGLADRLVGGEARPERWRVHGGEALGTTGALDAGAARRVAALVERLGGELGGPQDVEWALADGELFVLQARPITAAPIEPRFDDPVAGTWLRDRAHYPSTLSAFGASTYLPSTERAVAATAAEVGLMCESVQCHWRSGDVYMRVVPPGGKEGPAPPWWLLAIVSRLVPAIRKRTRAAELALPTMDTLVRDWSERGKSGFERRIRELEAVDLDALDDEALLAHLERVLALLVDGHREHFRLFIPWLLATHGFVCAARQAHGWDDGRSLAVLAGSSATSSAPGRELAALRERASAEVAASIAEADDPIARARELDPALGQGLGAWCERWGLRASSNDPGAPTLAEQPGLLAASVREAFGPETPRVAPLPDPPPASGGREDALDDRFERALAHARRVFPLREDNVLYTDSLPCGLARRAALAIGRRLRAARCLDRAEDAVELFADELRAALRDREDVAALARRRRAERAWVAAHPGPSVLCGAPAAPPDVRGLPGAARAINTAFLWAMGHEFPPDEAAPAGETLRGIGAWPGRYTGTVRVVRDDRDLVHVRAGDVLVAPITVPAWSIVFPRIGALVTDCGGALSHAAIVAREHGIPTVLNTGLATSRLASGQRVTVDGGAGTVVVAAP